MGTLVMLDDPRDGAGPRIPKRCWCGQVLQPYTGYGQQVLAADPLSVAATWAADVPDMARWLTPAPTHHDIVTGRGRCVATGACRGLAPEEDLP